MRLNEKRSEKPTTARITPRLMRVPHANASESPDANAKTPPRRVDGRAKVKRKKPIATKSDASAYVLGIAM